ncbi:hypothetical protein BDR03DRAFT_960092 [Suillus americanus]|nr:hypothetical protein BDR03DRAFT_960092 [Suillus americanus]
MLGSTSGNKSSRRDHVLQAESGTWPWHRQRPLRTSKREITHRLRAGHDRGTAGHGHGTVSVA